MWKDSDSNIKKVTFRNLEKQHGFDRAREMLLDMERSNGIASELVSAWSYEDRLRNVLHIASLDSHSFLPTKH
jgi:hypothetical protein